MEVTHATINAIFWLWIGVPEAILYLPEDAGRGWHYACTGHIVSNEDYRNVIPLVDIVKTIPTCPKCAILYDMALTDQRSEDDNE